MAIIIDNKFEIGETVYLKTDRDQLPRIIYCIKTFQSGVIYEMASGAATSAHYDFEISKDPNVVLQTSG